MRAWFSEFSYGYAVTESIVSSYGPVTAAPIFPSLAKEGKKGGYDVGLSLPGFPLFLQFKLSDGMLRDSAQEAKLGLLSSPFYRMHLRPGNKSLQHELLLDLESDGNTVYYVAPAFHREREFNHAYRSHSVLANSVFVEPSEIGHLSDNLEHHVSFQSHNSTFGYLFSESQLKVKIENWERVIRESKVKLERARIPLENVLQATETRMIEAVNRQFKRFPGWENISRTEEEDLARRLALLSQVFFDSTLFILQQR